ncbi:hypothetical protein [Endozoicomonas lisbonensis]|uniref:Uncharacterized protein n=1 Tax=Endozoicomonas lisbonensis TaxID=3120522 RepID=A0ABV2SF87_9GAMM
MKRFRRYALLASGVAKNESVYYCEHFFVTFGDEKMFHSLKAVYACLSVLPVMLGDSHNRNATGAAG